VYQIVEVSSSRNLCAKWKIFNNKLEQNAKTLFLDRDGVIILDHGYVNTISRTNLIEETIRMMWVANQNRIPITIISNQAGVAHGLFTESDLIEYNLDLLNLIKMESKVEVNSFYYCPSHPDGKLDAFRRSCICRKPMTGLFIEAKQDSKAVMSKSLFIGDRESDKATANNLSIPYLMYKANGIQDAILPWLAGEGGTNGI
jgi:D,D-heptose 1,7-bisphosphate phosphatase